MSKINFFEKFFQEYHHSVKRFGARSGLTKSGSKLFAKVISRRVGKDLSKPFSPDTKVVIKGIDISCKLSFDNSDEISKPLNRGRSWVS